LAARVDSYPGFAGFAGLFWPHLLAHYSAHIPLTTRQPDRQPVSLGSYLYKKVFIRWRKSGWAGSIIDCGGSGSLGQFPLASSETVAQDESPRLPISNNAFQFMP
jgi:hypothetical protein